MIDNPQAIHLIRHYNVIFSCFARSDREGEAIKFLTRNHASMSLQEIADWCESHHVAVEAHFTWLRGYPVLANVHNFIQYMIWRCSHAYT